MLSTTSAPPRRRLFRRAWWAVVALAVLGALLAISPGRSADAAGLFTWTRFFNGSYVSGSTATDVQASIYGPSTAAFNVTMPAVVLLHGGFVGSRYCTGNRKGDADRLAPELAERNIWVMTLNYRLTPAATDTNGDCVVDRAYVRDHGQAAVDAFNIDTVHDIQKGIRFFKSWLRSWNGGRQRFAAERVAAMGYSAGGVLSLTLGLQGVPVEPGASVTESTVKGVVGVVTAGTCTPTNPLKTDPRFGTDGWDPLRGCAMPVPSNMPRTLLLNGNAGDLSTVRDTTNDTDLYLLAGQPDGWVDDGVAPLIGAERTCADINAVAAGRCVLKTYTGTAAQVGHQRLGQNPSLAHWGDFKNTVVNFLKGT